MWKIGHYLIFTFLIIACGKGGAPHFSVELPPDNSPVATNDSPPAVEEPAQIASSPTAQDPLGVLVFNAPVVLVRGATPQHNTNMDGTPGL